MSDGVDLQALRGRILAEVRSQPAPARPVMRRRLLVGLAITLAFEAFLLVLIGGLHAGDRPVWLIAGNASGAAVVALVTTWLAFGRGRSMVGRPRSVVLAVVALVIPALLVSIALLNEGASAIERGVPPPGNHAQCFGLTALFSLVPLALLVLARRGSDPVHPTATGAALGASAGAWAAVAMAIVCPYSEITHELLGHLAPIVLVVLLGAWAGRSIIGLGGARHNRPRTT
jgi:hypothetical protein